MARDISPLQLDCQLCFALYSASNHVIRQYHPLLSGLKLTYPQYLVMLVLWEEGRCPVGTIAKRLNLDFGTLSPLLKRIEALGYLTRQRDPRDERRVMVELTPAGAELKTLARQIPAQVASHFSLSLDEAAELKRLLDKITPKPLP